jgi:hypothetical protein
MGRPTRGINRFAIIVALLVELHGASFQGTKAAADAQTLAETEGAEAVDQQVAELEHRHAFAAALAKLPKGDGRRKSLAALVAIETLAVAYEAKQNYAAARQLFVDVAAKLDPDVDATLLAYSRAAIVRLEGRATAAAEALDKRVAELERKPAFRAALAILPSGDVRRKNLAALVGIDAEAAAFEARQTFDAAKQLLVGPSASDPWNGPAVGTGIEFRNAQLQPVEAS